MHPGEWEAEMLRTAFITSNFLLAIGIAIQANGSQLSSLELEFKQQHLDGIDNGISIENYEELYHNNQKYLRGTLKSYSMHVLGSVGIPDKMTKIIGASVGFITNGAKLDLNQSKTFAIEFKDVGTQDRAMYFSVDLDW